MALGDLGKRIKDSVKGIVSGAGDVVEGTVDTVGSAVAGTLDGEPLTLLRRQRERLPTLSRGRWRPRATLVRVRYRLPRALWWESSRASAR